MATTDEIMGYVLNSPHNTNPNVLKDMLDSVSGGSSASICEFSVDFDTGQVELLEKASVLYEQKKNGALIAHYKMTISDTAYQEVYFDVFACAKSVNGTNESYEFNVNLGEMGSVVLEAGNGDNHPVGHIDFDTDGE